MSEAQELDLWPLAQEAAALLNEYSGPRRSELAVRTKTGAEDLVTRADAAVQELSCRWLAERSEYPVVGEEGGASEGGKLFWSLDPLDGTREFVQGYDEFAFQLALVHEGTPVQAALAIPAAGLVYLAGRGKGVRCLRLADGKAIPLPESPAGKERLVLSRAFDHRPRLQRLVAEHPAVRLLCGGVGAKVHKILQGGADTYLAVPSGMYGWDLAAPLLVAREAGLRDSDFSGNPLKVPADRQPVPEGVLFTRPAFREANLSYLRGRHC